MLTHQRTLFRLVTRPLRGSPCCSCVCHLVFSCFSCRISITLTGMVAAVAIPDAKRKIYAEITVKFCSVSADRVSESWDPQATKTLVESNWSVIMAATPRAPKQWCLSKTETITSFESWRQNLVYTLSLDTQFAPFLVDGATWRKKTKANPLRGFTDDRSSANPRRTAHQKVNTLELMLGQIANYCPVISRNTIVKNCTSVDCIWASIRLHYGFQVTGVHFVDFTDIHLEHGERPEDLFQRLMAFMEDNLLRIESLTHHGERVEPKTKKCPLPWRILSYWPSYG